MEHDILTELKSLTDYENTQGKIAAELHDITEQYREGILNKEEYLELIDDIEKINKANDLANDEITSRWLTETVKILISVV